MKELFTCTSCREEKPKEEFANNASKPRGIQVYCKACNKLHQRDNYYRRKYGHKFDYFTNMLSEQGNACKICDEQIEFADKGRYTKIGNDAVVDHCHGTGAIRGILCGLCNTGLGAFKDKSSNFQSAINYLQVSETCKD